MLVAMAITLVMMGAVVTLFANVSGSIRNRRATVEMTNQLRIVRNTMQQDLRGATCPGLTWQRPESNHGYIELIEGQQTDQNPTPLLRDADGDGTVDPADQNETRLDPVLSSIPRNNVGLDADSDGKISVQEREAHHQRIGSLVPGGLGDFDDILMLTVRNEHEPFVGRMPDDVRQPISNPNPNDGFSQWGEAPIESPLAEVVWFAVENPTETERANNFFGEPGMRTIYRRTLLIAPWINPYLDPDIADANGLVRADGGLQFKAEPGLARLLPQDMSVEQAIAAVIAFQDRYDLSVRLEWDHSLGNSGRWKIMANTLGDLTKRENRFGHYGFRPGSGTSAVGTRFFPYPVISQGSGYTGISVGVTFLTDPEIQPPTDSAEAQAMVEQGNRQTATGNIISFTADPANFDTPTNTRRYIVRPFAHIADPPTGGVPATCNAILNDAGQVVRVVHGPVPLWGSRRGEDVMMTGALAFDIRVYDPGAPLFGFRYAPNPLETSVDVVLEPSDAGWRGQPTNPPVNGAYLHNDNMRPNGSGAIGTNVSNSAFYPYMGQGAFVDMGYGYDKRWQNVGGTAMLIAPRYATLFASAAPPWFFDFRALPDVFGNQLAPGFAVYDTWSFHYENNGVNEDADTVQDSTGAWVSSIDEGTNGFDDKVHNGADNLLRAGDQPNEVPVLGVDDTGERETVPPYDRPLRGLQVLMRVYEPDSRAIRQVRVNQHFMPE
jgi:hypothetical protein